MSSAVMPTSSRAVRPTCVGGAPVRVDDLQGVGVEDEHPFLGHVEGLLDLPDAPLGLHPVTDVADDGHDVYLAVQLQRAEGDLHGEGRAVAPGRVEVEPGAHRAGPGVPVVGLSVGAVQVPDLGRDQLVRPRPPRARRPRSRTSLRLAGWRGRLAVPVDQQDPVGRESDDRPRDRIVQGTLVRPPGTLPSHEMPCSDRSSRCASRRGQRRAVRSMAAPRRPDSRRGG